MWKSIAIKPGRDAQNADYFARLIIKAEHLYRAAGASLGVPWYFIGALHMRESACDFAGVLHNGDRIIGKGTLTYRVPKGRGPFNSWAEAADDALRLKNFGKYRGQWCPSLMAYVSEIYNGLGYVGRGVNSAYLWAGSNHEQLGKYVRDGVWDGNHDDVQIGTMTVLKRLCELRPDIAEEMVEREMSATTKVVVGGAAGATVGAGGTVIATQPSAPTDPVATVTDVATSSSEILSVIVPMMTGWTGAFATAFGVALIAGFVWYQFYRRRLD